jgi:CO/xanthine dehydrogenase FAD-binding subunit
MGFVLQTPSSPEEAIRALAGSPPGSVAVLAGGTDLLLDVEAGRARPGLVLSLRRLPWRGIELDEERVRIGSLAPLRSLERHPGLRDGLPGLWEAVRAVGSPPLRQRATLGGNIVRGAPASDLLPILLALEARVGLTGPEGSRELPLGALLDRPRRPKLRPAELVEWVELRREPAAAFVWQRVRPANDISQVGVAAARSARGGGWNVALGGFPGVPARLPEVERELAGAELSEERVRAAAAAAERTRLFGTDRRASADYRDRVAGILTGRALRLVRSRRPGGPGGS